LSSCTTMHIPSLLGVHFCAYRYSTFETDMANPSVVVDPAMYRDYAEEPTTACASGSTVDTTKTNGSFSRKLHYVLEEMEKDGMGHIASWAPHGRCFMIHKPDLFVEQVLKK
jgi:hypothetical protein